MPQEKRVALVTGGAVRVGRAIVEKLLAQGFAVALTYHGSGEAADELTRLGDVHITQADFAHPAVAVEHVRDHLSLFTDHIDVLVNNASIYKPGSTFDDLHAMMAVHVEAPMLLTQSLAPLLRKVRGHVVNMVDLNVERPQPGYAAYCASKAALANLTLSLARELAPEVTVNGIAPGVVEWPKNFPEAERDKYLKRVPLARPGTPQDVANLVHFLCTTGSYITGQIIRLDGGRSIT